MFIFYWPWLGLLVFLPLVIIFALPASKKNTASSPEVNFPALRRLQDAFPTYQVSGNNSGKFFKVIISLLWICLVLTVMRPQKVDQLSYVQHEGYDLMLAVDISGSMRALDFSTEDKRVSRLDVTKDVVGKFVKDRQGDRVGLVLFGQYAYLHVPFTLDTTSVSKMLDNTVAGMAGDATSIGDAIGMAVKNLRNRPENSRVIILLTDGEDTASSIPPLEAAKLAKQYDIKIYTIGVGNEGNVPYPTDSGRIVMANMSMDEELLEKIAEITDGKYFRATDEDSLQSIYNKINEMEKTESEVKEYLIRKPLYRYPLGVAVILMLFICIVPLYRRAIHGV
jgi:Ca-activated chloride channel family protein